MVALTVFVVAGLACTGIMGILNRSAAVNRAGVAAQILLAAKINKLITVNYDTRDNAIPAACDPTTTPAAGTNVINGIDVGGLETFNSLATDGYSADTSDFWGAVASGSATPPTGTSVTLVADSSNRAIVTGTIYRRVSVFEAYTHTMEVTYSIVYTIAGRTFVTRQSLIRSPDVQ